MKIKTLAEWANVTFLQWKYGGKGTVQHVTKDAKRALEYWPLVQPLEKGNLKLQHRVAVAPMTRMRNNPETRGVSDAMREFYRQRASHGGLTISEAFAVHGAAAGTPRCPVIETDAQQEELRLLFQFLEEKAPTHEFAVQLFHSGKTAWVPAGTPVPACDAAPVKTETPEGWSPSNFLTLSQLGIPIGTPHEAGQADIDVVKQQYKTACQRVKAAGGKRVDLLFGGQGFVHDFIMQSVNTRTDKYGHGTSGRARLAKEIIDIACAELGAPNVGITIHLPYTNFGQCSSYAADAPTYYDIAQYCNDVKVGHLQYWNRFHDAAAPACPEFLDFHSNEERFLRNLRETYTGTLIEMGFGTNFDKAALKIAAEEIDVASFGRAFAAVPDLANRLRHGVDVHPNMMQADRDARPTDYLQTEFVSIEQDTHGYIDWAPSDLPEPIETPEVITL
eukprot:Rhum_TRINITY_DN18656_c0_g1::Rhum_TRINITY_DN18656_c0_g1_i1::g.168015::m.168015